MKWFFTTFVLTPSVIFACDMQRSLSETQFTIDPSTNKMKLETLSDNTRIQVSKCTPDEKFLLINFNSIYYQDDTSRIESISGNLIQKASNCSIQSETPAQKIDATFLQTLVQSRHNFLRKCVRLAIVDQTGQKITTHPQSACQLKAITADGSTVETDGAGCLIAVNPNSNIAMEARLNPDCLQSSFLSSNQIQAQDIESVIKLWPVGSEAGKLSVQNPIGSRYIRHTILPAKDFMPRTVKDDQDDLPYISALSTNISAGQISMSSMGKNKVVIQPTFFVENIAKEYCKGTECARVSGYVAPIAGLLTLSKINSVNGKKTQIGEWPHALKVPANWTGMAEFKTENNLTGMSMGALTANITLTPGDEFVLESKFFEPRSYLDELSLTQNFFDLNSSLDAEGSSEDALPTLPKVGQLLPLPKMPTLPSVGLGRAGVLDFSDRMNMKKNWSQKYDRVCNSQNLNCVKLSGFGTPFVTLKAKFKIGPNKEVIAEHVTKSSAAFESYDQDVTYFTKKVCE
ncbi:MAG: hypothetical protein H7256_03270 [Bdellovibrio sp.]|nr:hypothetical protein [Bdellovibrio sp.]